MLGTRPRSTYVLVFENRGEEVGATITIPTARSTRSTFVPERRSRELAAGHERFSEPGDRLVARVPGWRAWVPEAPVFPYALCSSRRAVPDLPSLGDAGRDGLASCSSTCWSGFDRAFDAPDAVHALDPPAPLRRRRLAAARLHVEIVSPWRAPGVPRFVAAGEIGSGLFFNPVAPEVAARSLRDAHPSALASAASSRCSSLGGRRSWESPELPSLNRLQRATLSRSRRRSSRPLDAASRSTARRRLGVPTRRAPEEAAGALAPGPRLEHGRGAVPLDDAGLRPAALHERRDAVRRAAAARPRARTRRASTGARSRSRAAGVGGRIVLGFGGVEGALYVLLNGTPVGISKDSRTPAEFDVTDLVRHDGPNELVAVVVRWSDASFIEDQDQWWHAGLSRPVYLYATGATHIADVFARGELDDAYRDGRLAVAASVGGPASTASSSSPAGPAGRRCIATAAFDGRSSCRQLPRRWSAEDPALYTLVVSLRGGPARASPAASASAASRFATAGCS